MDRLHHLEMGVSASLVKSDFKRHPARLDRIWTKEKANKIQLLMHARFTEVLKDNVTFYKVEDTLTTLIT